MKIPGLILTFALLLGGTSCAALRTSADDSAATANGETANSSKSENQAGAETAKKAGDPAGADKTAKPAAQQQSLAGTYKFETYPANKSGYVNSLEVEDKGAGKLGVYFSATYVYPANGAETFKEASGGGDGALRGNTLTASLTEDGGAGEEKPCKVTITFTGGAQAAVKTADDCGFNVALDGIYKKAAAKKAPPAKTAPKPAAKLREINFEKLNDFVNDFGRNRTGMRYVITHVLPVKIAQSSRADEYGNREYRGLHYLETAEDDETGSAGFITSAQMLKSLQENHDTKPVSLRVTAVLVQSDGEFDVYRLSFVTKIEGLDENEEVLWTATGAEPAKLKFRH